MKRNFTPELQPEVAYSIPFEWGQLHVSEAAHTAYDIVPLTTVADGPNLEAKIDANPEIHLTLVAPSEGSAEPLQPHKHKKNDLVIARTLAGLPSKAELLDGLSAGIDLMKQLGDGLDEPIDDLTDDNGINIHEVFRNDVPQILAHELSNLARETTAAAVRDTLLELDAKKAYRKFRLMGAAAVLGTSFVLSPQLFTHEGLNPIILAYSTAYGLYLSGRTSKQVNRYITSQPERTQAMTVAGLIAGRQVASDIHASFCRHQFDRRAEKNILEDNGPEDSA